MTTTHASLITTATCNQIAAASAIETAHNAKDAARDIYLTTPDADNYRAYASADAKWTLCLLALADAEAANFAPDAANLAAIADASAARTDF